MAVVADTAAEAEAGLRTEFPAVSGPVRFDAQRNPHKPGVIMQIRNGRRIYRATVAPPRDRATSPGS